MILLSASALGASARTAAASPHGEHAAAMGNQKPAAAAAQLPRFRAECDAEGFPLVGNMGSKAPPPPPSEVCSRVRDEAVLATAKPPTSRRADTAKVVRAAHTRADRRS